MANWTKCQVCDNDCYDHNAAGTFAYYCVCAPCAVEVGNLQTPGWDSTFSRASDKRMGQRYRINDSSARARMLILIDKRNAKIKTAKCFLCENVCYRRFNFRYNTCAECTSLVMKNTKIIKNDFKYHRNVNPKDGYSYKSSIWKTALIALKKRYDNRNNPCDCVPWYCSCKETWTLPK